MAGNIGADAIRAGTIPFLFGEDQARYVLAAPREAAKALFPKPTRAACRAFCLATTGGDKIAVEGQGEIALERLRKAHEAGLPAYMTGEL